MQQIHAIPQKLTTGLAPNSLSLHGMTPDLTLVAYRKQDERSMGRATRIEVNK